ncbi:LptA/OstA family protein [Oceanithermus sp.]
MLRKISLGVLFLLLAAAPPAASNDCPTCPQVELDRNGKPIVAVKTSPDEVSDVFVIEYLDVQTGELQSLNREARTATINGLRTWWNDASRLAPDLRVGDFVWAVYNPDLTNDAGYAYLLELKPAPPGQPAHHQMQRFIIYDPAPYQTLVRFGSDARAYGHLALVERVKGVYEKITLGDGSASYLEDEDRFVTAFTEKNDAVSVVQGKSRASGKRLEYDNDSGNAVLAGPVTLKRTGEEPLDGSADELTYNVDSEEITLMGEVVLKQNDRTTNANSAILLESAGYAYLYGDPVVSTGPDGEVRGLEVRYNLDNGELFVLKDVNAVFEDN